METTKTLDQQANTSAQAYMGALAWPTIIFAAAVFAAYLGTLGLTFLGHLPLAIAIPLTAILTYLTYTVLHESAHGSITGSHKGLRWLNEALGYLAAWIIMIPLTAHRHEHLAHHRHTNEPEADPDFAVSGLTRSPFHALWYATEVYIGQFTYYLRNRWHNAPRKQNLYFCLETALIFVPRLALLSSPYFFEALSLFGIAWLFGLSNTVYLFAYLVHRPHEDSGRYVDTSTITTRSRRLNSIVTLLWVYQNYHSIHHLFPRVPFYQYPALFGDIAPIMEAKGAPFYELGIHGMQPLATRDSTDNDLSVTA